MEFTSGFHFLPGDCWSSSKRQFSRRTELYVTWSDFLSVENFHQEMYRNADVCNHHGKTINSENVFRPIRFERWMPTATSENLASITHSVKWVSELKPKVQISPKWAEPESCLDGHVHDHPQLQSKTWKYLFLFNLWFHPSQKSVSLKVWKSGSPIYHCVLGLVIQYIMILTKSPTLSDGAATYG